jgi:hypothetical protein
MGGALRIVFGILHFLSIFMSAGPKKMATGKPEDWVGVCEDQQELFVEILANLTMNEVMDRNHNCVTFKSFGDQLPSLLFEEKYYDIAETYFRAFLAAWCVVYHPKTGIMDRQLVDADLSRKLYAAYLLSIKPDGKVKIYTKVYEDLARDR